MASLVKKKPSLLLNAASTWLPLALNSLIGFVLTPFVIKHLGNSGYGIWTLVGAYVGYYGVLDFGIRSAVAKYIAQYTAEANPLCLNQVVSTGLALFCTTGLVAIIISLGIANELVNFFHITPNERSAFVNIVRIMGFTVGISFPGNVLGAVVIAREQFVAFNLIACLITVLRATLTFLMLKAGLELIGIGISFLVTAALGTISNMILFRIYADDISLSWSAVDIKTVKKLITYGGIATIIVVSDMFRTNIDSFVIGRCLNMKEVAIYGIATLIIRYMINFIGASMSVLTPRFTSLDSFGQDSKLISLFQQSLFVSGFLSFGLGSMILLFGKWFIYLWLGISYKKSAIILYVLVIGWILDLAQNPSVWLLYALNKHKYYAILTMGEGLLNLALSIILVADLGIVGVAMGTLISMVTFRLFVQPIYISRVVNMNIIAYLRPFLLPFITSMLTLLVIYCLKFNVSIEKHGFLGLIFCASCAGGFFVSFLSLGSFLVSPGVPIDSKLGYFSGLVRGVKKSKR